MRTPSAYAARPGPGSGHTAFAPPPSRSFALGLRRDHLSVVRLTRDSTGKNPPTAGGLRLIGVGLFRGERSDAPCRICAPTYDAVRQRVERPRRR
jgi:hypothetical protein